ncbi:uncharacterized protein LOC9298854 [Arabidopsis lyrata subsp. lyrata]|uniref:uncharacterized protein LOC9298854 n=1 Tax=Arabidopsis lyrata subsp. lyrata TaxID=81972 RepID=UPI000A29C58F|nr:uncharacterized protein LOC9298854 [Arabidopsis lyrata subsp. lyrata]|eukprot:XP_020872679.1 uncharacterized protein LOC9298854 [Arabidopsis lyrata subsp. lyrata]
MPQPILVDPPTEALHGFPPMDAPSAVMPTTTVDRVIPVLPSPSTLPTSRPQPRRSKRLHSSAAPQVSTPAPAPKLRLRDTSEDVKLKTSSSSVISTLAKPSPTKVTALMSQLRRYTKSEYSISGSVFPATLFFDILKPQKWVSSMHMDLLIAFVWDTQSLLDLPPDHHT